MFDWDGALSFLVPAYNGHDCQQCLQLQSDVVQQILSFDFTGFDKG